MRCILIVLLLAGCYEVAPPPIPPIEEISNQIKEGDYRLAAESIKQLPDQTTQDSLYLVLADARKAFEVGTFEDFKSAFKDIRERHKPLYSYSTDRSSWSFSGRRDWNKSLWLEFIYLEDLNVFSWSGSAGDPDTETIQIECGESLIYSGDYVFTEFSWRSIESDLERIRSTDDCTIWIKPFDTKRAFTGTEKQLISDMLQLKEIIVRTTKAAFSISDLF